MKRLTATVCFASSHIGSRLKICVFFRSRVVNTSHFCLLLGVKLLSVEVIVTDPKPGNSE